MDTSMYEQPGRELVERIESDLAERSLVLDPREAVLLAEAASIADRLAAIRRSIKRSGLLIENKKSGAKKANPLLHLERVLQQDLARLLGRIKLEVPPDLSRGDLHRIATKGSGPRQRAIRDRIARGEAE